MVLATDPDLCKGDKVHSNLTFERSVKPEITVPLSERALKGPFVWLVVVYRRSTAELETASQGYQELPVTADVFAAGTIVELNNPCG